MGKLDLKTRNHHFHIFQFSLMTQSLVKTGLLWRVSRGCLSSPFVEEPHQTRYLFDLLVQAFLFKALDGFLQQRPATEKQGRDELSLKLRGICRFVQRHRTGRYHKHHPARKTNTSTESLSLGSATECFPEALCNRCVKRLKPSFHVKGAVIAGRSSPIHREIRKT